MALPRNINTLEVSKFRECADDGGVVVATTLCGGVETRPSGLNIAGKITETTINSTSWSPLPATTLTDRNAISIQNVSGVEIKINYDNTVTGYVGMVIANNSERYIDVGDNIIIYAKSASGTPTLNIEEIS